MNPLYLRTLSALIGLALASGEAHAATTWTVTSTGEPASITSAACAGTCTLRDAINAAASGDTIRFAPALDGATIALSLYSNPASGQQFGASAFYISGKSLIIDATLNGLTQGVVISAQTANAGCSPGNCFRLFDVNTGAGLTFNGVTLTGGKVSAPGGALAAGGAVFNRGVLAMSRSSLVENSVGSPDGGGSGAGGGFGGGGGGGGAGVGSTGAGALQSYAGGGGNPNPGNGGTGFPPVAATSGGFGGGGGGGGGGYVTGFVGFGGGFGGGGGGGGSSSYVGAGAGGSGAGGGPAGFGAGGGGGGASSGFGGAGSASGGGGGFGGGPGGFGNRFGGAGGGSGGGAGMGGAIFNDAGSVSLTNVTFSGNAARGGTGGGGGAGNGSGLGGALFNFTGSMLLTYVTIAGNSVDGGTPDGSGIYSLGDGNCGNGGNLACTSGTSIASLALNQTIVDAGIGGTNAVVIDQTNPGNISNLSTSGGVGNLVASNAGKNGASFDAGVVTTAAPDLAALPSPLKGGKVDVRTPNGGSSPAVNAIACAASPLIDQRGAPRPDPASASLTAPCDIGAVEPVTYAITSTASPVAGGTVTCTPASVNAGGSSTCTASANPGYIFTAFSGDCTGSTCVLANIQSNKSVTATFEPFAPATILKAFGASTIGLSGTTSLTFTLTNPNANASQTGVSFTDNLPAGLVVATPNDLTNTCGGTATVVAGASSASLAGATLAASASCTLVLSVKGATTGVKNNSVQVSSTNGGIGNTSNASVTVTGSPPAIAKVFGAGTIALNGSTSLTFTITNPNAGAALTDVAFADSMPAGLVVAAPSGLTNTCGGTATAIEGDTSASLSGATLATGASCTMALVVQATTPGVKNNSVQVSSTNGGIGNTANATLTVVVDEIYSDGFEAVTRIITLGIGFDKPRSIAVDSSGNVFVADFAGVKEIVKAGGYSTVNTLGSGFDQPFGVAVDTSGNVFVADTNNNAVKEILAPGYATVITLGSGFSYPCAVAVDGSGNVFVADTFNNAVKVILAAGGYTTVNTLGSGFVYPYGVAVDTSGNVLVADTFNNAVKEILAPGYTTADTLGSGFSHPTGVAVDASGNVFVADYDHSAVKEMLAADGYTTINTLGSGFSRIAGVAVDAGGNVFVTDYDNNAVKEIVPPGGSQ